MTTYLIRLIFIGKNKESKVHSTSICIEIPRLRDGWLNSSYLEIDRAMKIDKSGTANMNILTVRSDLRNCGEVVVF